MVSGIGRLGICDSRLTRIPEFLVEVAVDLAWARLGRREEDVIHVSRTEFPRFRTEFPKSARQRLTKRFTLLSRVPLPGALSTTPRAASVGFRAEPSAIIAIIRATSSASASR